MKTDKEKWAERSRIKLAKIDGGQEHVSGRKLNEEAGLPTHATWYEERFA